MHAVQLEENCISNVIQWNEERAARASKRMKRE